jgi:hypothetical protein
VTIRRVTIIGTSFNPLLHIILDVKHTVFVCSPRLGCRE